MIQRLQSLYYLLALMLVGLMALWPIATIEGLILDINSAGHLSVGSAFPFPMAYFGYLVMALSILCIWMYKDRKKQLIIGRVNYFILLFYIVVICMTIEQNSSALLVNGAVEYGPSLFLPLVALAFLFMANRAVKKDEDLVRSLDRLR